MILVFKMCTWTSLQMSMWSVFTCRRKTHLSCSSHHDFWRKSRGGESEVSLLSRVWTLQMPANERAVFAFAAGCSLAFHLLADGVNRGKSLLSNLSGSVTLFLQHLPQAILPQKDEVGLFQGQELLTCSWSMVSFPICSSLSVERDTNKQMRFESSPSSKLSCVSGEKCKECVRATQHM